MSPLLLIAATTLFQTPAARLNAFGLALMKAGAKSEANELFSPISASAAMTLLLNASSGSTFEAISRVMQVENLHQANEESGALLRSLTETPGKEVTLANAIFAPTNMELGQSFVNDIQTSFSATVERLRSEGAAEQVNQWVAIATKNRIPRLFSSLSPTSVVLANAVTFDGQWVMPFRPNRTQNSVFHATGGDQQAPMMRRTGMMTYRELPDHREVELPYRGDEFAMRILLPNDGDPALVLASIEPTPPEDRNVQSVELMMPKFTFSAENDLRGALTKVGLGSLFSRAEVARMSPTHPVTHVSQAIQKAWIEVDEAGTKAAAATAIAMPSAIFGGRQTIPFHVDHPFAFLLEDKKSGVILFAGIVRRIP